MVYIPGVLNYLWIKAGSLFQFNQKKKKTVVIQPGHHPVNDGMCVSYSDPYFRDHMDPWIQLKHYVTYILSVTSAAEFLLKQKEK